MPLNDFQYEFDGLLMGPDQPFGLNLVEGLNPPESRVSIVDRAEDHGAFIHASLLQHREITLTGDMVDSNFETSLDLWRKAFRPVTSPKGLKFKLPTRPEQVIFCYPARRHYAMNPMYSLGYLGEWIVQLLAPDPRIYSLEEHVESTGPTTPAAGVDFDVTFDIDFGGTVSDGRVDVENVGVFSSPHRVVINGPAIDPTIKNVTTNERTSLEIELGVDDELEIDYKDKTVILNGFSSRYSALALDNKWWQIEPGVNTLQFISGTIGPTTEMTVHWRDAWL